MLKRLSTLPMGCLLLSLGACRSSSEAVFAKRSSDSENVDEEEDGSSDAMGSAGVFEELCLMGLNALEARSWADSEELDDVAVGDVELKSIRELVAAEVKLGRLTVCKLCEATVFRA